MQNTAAIVFQGEAGGATRGPICSLVDTLPLLVTLHCHGITVQCARLFLSCQKPLCSVLCSSLFISSLSWPLSEDLSYHS